MVGSVLGGCRGVAEASTGGQAGLRIPDFEKGRVRTVSGLYAGLKSRDWGLEVNSAIFSNKSEKIALLTPDSDGVLHRRVG